MKKEMTNTLALATLALTVIALGATATAAADYKIGVFDSGRVIMESQVGQNAQAELNAYKNDRQKLITAREKELETKNNEFVNKSLTLSEERRQELREELEDLRREFQRFYQDNERDLIKEMEKMQKTLQRQLTLVIEEFGKREGYTMIFERLQCVYNSEAVDVTEDVVRAFDAKFASR
jgi:outer membrane protein